MNTNVVIFATEFISRIICSNVQIFVPELLIIKSCLLILSISAAQTNYLITHSSPQKSIIWLFTAIHRNQVLTNRERVRGVDRADFISK